MLHESLFLVDLGIVAAFTLSLSIIFARLKLSTVPAQILAGMIAGPFILGWIRDITVINDLSTVGIVLLLFVIGLELEPSNLLKVAGRAIVISSIGLGISFFIGFVAALLIGGSFLQSVIFALAISFTSTAVVSKVFISGKRLSHDEYSTLMGVLIVEDLIAVLSLVSMSSLVSGGPVLSAESLLRMFETILGGIGLAVLGFLVARFVAPRVIDYLSSFEGEYEEIPFLFALGLGFLFAILASYLGYSPGIGAFIIGLSIRGDHSKLLEGKVTAIKDFFLLLFFFSMGVLIDPYSALGIGAIAFAVIALVASGKFIGGFIAAHTVMRLRSSDSYRYGTWLTPRGEFSFVIGQLALGLGIMSERFFSLMGVLVIITAVLASILQRAKWFNKAH